MVLNGTTARPIDGVPDDGGAKRQQPLRRYLWVEQTLGSVVFNFVLNGAIAAGLTLRHPILLWGARGIALDLVVMSFLLPFGTCIVNSAIVRRDVRNGRVAPLDTPLPERLKRLPSSTFVRALFLALAFVALYAPALTLALVHARVFELTMHDFMLFKATVATSQAALITPIVALYALGTPPSR